MAMADIKAPLTPKEEQRLSTLANFCTLALFRPLDTARCTAKHCRETGNLHLGLLWRGWPRQILNKAVDDEIFQSNIARVTKVLEESLNLEKPGNTPQGKALVGVLARILTIGVMLPFQAAQDPLKRNLRFGRSPKLGMPIVPLYRGLQRSIAKESVFTASYILSSNYIGIYLDRYRPQVRDMIVKNKQKIEKCTKWKLCKDCDQEGGQKCQEEVCTNIAMTSMRNAAAGVVATLCTAPIEVSGRNLSMVKKIELTGRKAIRKGCYNGINTIILQTLQYTKFHRRVAYAALDIAPKDKSH